MSSFRMIRIGIKTSALAVMLLMTAFAMADIAIPPLKAHVTDLTATLSASETVQLEQKLIAFEKTKGSQIAVLIVSTTQPETIEQYSIRVAENWKLGRKGSDDGVLLLISKTDRTLRIEVGYGLEGAIPDAIAKRIIAETITPHFKQGHFANGIDAGIETIMSLIKGESLPAPKNMKSGIDGGETHTPAEHFIFILIGSILLGRTVQVFLGRLVGASVMSIGAGIIGWFAFSSIAFTVLIALAVFLTNLFLNSGGGFYRNGRSGWPDHSDYRHDGFDRGGGSGGGFGGGGGGFGGGGASGRW